MTMRTTVFGFLCVASFCLLFSWMPSRAAQEKKPKNDPANLWMAKKLEFSQKILAGLTRADFDLIQKNAESMYAVGYLEKADMANLPEYREHVKGFDATTKDLIKYAKDKNIKGASESYAKLVVRCVDCHKIVRDAKAKK